MAAKRPTKFNPKTFLGKVGTGKTNLTLEKHHTIFSQGDEADAVFFVRAGKVKLSIVSQQGKEAVLALLEPGAFFGNPASPDRSCAWQPRLPKRHPFWSGLKKPP